MPQADVPMLHRARFGYHDTISGSRAEQAAAARIAALEVHGAWEAGRAACMGDTSSQMSKCPCITV
jgi:hypothetical protein